MVTVLLHGLVLGGLFSLVAWREPDPPLPQVGIELNLGVSDEGSGDEQPVPDQTETQPEQSQPEPEVSPQPEPEPQQPVKSETVTVPEESPVAVQTKPAPKKQEPVKEPTPPKEKPKEKPVEKKETPIAVYKPQPESQTAKPDAGQGDAQNSSSDKGKPEGKVDAAAVYTGQNGGKSGSGGGTGLELAGWKWDREPNPKVSEQEKSGKIVFEVEVDSDGQITKLVTIERGISLDAERICRAEVLKLRLVQIDATVPEFSKGRITIVVNSR